ncbi:hydantoinase B/oxoprolinase family protein [Devosia sp. FJ2-5-3]|uniref:hydantoinase B/oxoprolinase family protein n=1 Tax=Devosia sp. FJ2-5-3 TaxID=2976680 RepID=UPI0023D7C8E7|nr:hydantoinase B/oxoprolinase family protein [Devosia sp. FJ2-5-3]WEJ57023.1 hydantoinase B/oxoprolinase family protein [Devosia sp. FJ2-5-3]
MDTVTLSVVRGALDQVANEMDLHFIQSAFSPIISEMNDCANGIYHPVTGETIAQGQYGLPVFLANMQLAVGRLIPIVEENGGFRPGDVWAVNDPYLAGTHLSDVTMISPFYHEGEVVALLASTGHWMDIGGGAAGGWAPNSTDIHQEGTMIPPFKLVSEGVVDEGALRFVLANLRLPVEVRGDIAAMRSVFDIGQKRLARLYERYGAAEMASGVTEMMDRSEKLVRSYISELPDGEYEFVDHIDNDGHSDEALPIRLRAIVRGDELLFDFTGTAKSPRGTLNLPEITTMSACYVGFKHLFPEVPINGGTFRPIRFVIPQDSMLAAKYPKPVGGYLEVSSAVMNVVFGALAKVTPERAPAAWFGTTGALTFGGIHPDTGRYFVSTWIYPGGYGGSATSDGLVHGTSPLSLAKIMSFELAERRAPIRFRNVSLRDDTGGAGARMGGCGSSYEIETLADCSISILGDRVDHQPFGILGGGEGAGNDVTFSLQGQPWVPPMRSKCQNVMMRAGDWVRASSPGGGGYGNPLDRSLELVERDLNLGYISRETAEAVFGAVIAEETRAGDRSRYALDMPASQSKRNEMSAEGARETA